MRGSAAVAG